MYIFQETSKQNEGSYDGGKWDNVTGISYFKDNEQYPPLNLANIERFFSHLINKNTLNQAYWQSVPREM